MHSSEVSPQLCETHRHVCSACDLQHKKKKPTEATNDMGKLICADKIFPSALKEPWQEFIMPFRQVSLLK